MNCPACKHDVSAVEGTIPYASVNLRKRRCKRCGYVWNTAEMPSDISILLEHCYRLTKKDADEMLLKAQHQLREQAMFDAVKTASDCQEIDTAHLEQKTLL